MPGSAADKFKLVSDTWWLARKPSNGDMYMTQKDDAPTGIDLSEELRVKSDEFATAPIHNLSGQSVTKMGKGLYIINGKKIVIK